MDKNVHDNDSCDIKDEDEDDNEHHMVAIFFSPLIIFQAT
jgi:hypothetical protein